MNVVRTLKSTEAPLVDIYDCAMLDLDGVVYVGQAAVEGAPELLGRVRERGVTLAFVTNNAARTPDEVAAHLTEIGVDAATRDVVTSAQAAARAIAGKFGPGAKVLVAGGEGLLVALDERGLEVVTSSDDEPVAVVQGFHPSVGWSMLAEATFAVRAGAYWVASNLDMTVPTAKGIAPGNGSLVDVVATALGRRPDLVAGKPFRPLFDETVLRIESRHPIVVGDRLDTDIEGARNCEADSLLVMTGVTDVDQLCHAEPYRRPDFVSWTLEGLMTSHVAPLRREGGWVCGEWRADVRDGHVVLAGPAEDGDPSADGVRAAAVAAWTWIDAHPGTRVDTTQATEVLRGGAT